LPKLTLSFKGTLLKIFPIGEGEHLIGNDPACEIHIDSLAVRPRHAAVTRQGEEMVLRDLGTEEGTFVNNERMTQHTLRDGDTIRVGKHTLTYRAEPTAEETAAAPAPPAPDAPPPPPEDAPAFSRSAPRTAGLQILNGQNLGKTIILNRNLTNLGKTGVQTAVIARRNEGYFLSHLEGEQTPRVNGQAIGDRSWRLEDGQVIQIGNVRMQFYLQ